MDKYTKNAPPFTLGMEEEYWLVNNETNDLVKNTPSQFLKQIKEVLGDTATHEFLRSQIEVGTKPYDDLNAIYSELKAFRLKISEVANKHNMSLVASSSHPFADYRKQKHTPKKRYSQLAADFQEITKRLLICGMHIHIGIPDNELKIDLMNQFSYFLPHILPLTTSSPFWEGRDTGLLSYRLTVFDALPRTGLPEDFISWGEYQRFLTLLQKTNAIEDGTKIWWDLRANANWPTLEVRISDICTNLRDAIAVAALARCLIRMLYRLRVDNRKWRVYPKSLINENRWRAQRYSLLKDNELKLIDCGISKAVNYKTLVDEIMDIISKDIKFFGYQEFMAHIYIILKRGTSADRQRLIYDKAIKKGETKEKALYNVVEWLKKETLNFE